MESNRISYGLLISACSLYLMTSSGSGWADNYGPNASFSVHDGEVPMVQALAGAGFMSTKTFRIKDTNRFIKFDQNEVDCGQKLIQATQEGIGNRIDVTLIDTEIVMICKPR